MIANIGESQTQRIMPHQINKNPGRYDAEMSRRARVIKTTGGTGQPRGYSSFYHDGMGAQQTFKDSKGKLYK